MSDDPTEARQLALANELLQDLKNLDEMNERPGWRSWAFVFGFFTTLALHRERKDGERMEYGDLATQYGHGIAAGIESLEKHGLVGMGMPEPRPEKPADSPPSSLPELNDWLDQHPWLQQDGEVYRAYLRGGRLILSGAAGRYIPLVTMTPLVHIEVFYGAEGFVVTTRPALGPPTEESFEYVREGAE